MFKKYIFQPKKPKLLDPRMREFLNSHTCLSLQRISSIKLKKYTFGRGKNIQRN